MAKYVYFDWLGPIWSMRTSALILKCCLFLIWFAISYDDPWVRKHLTSNYDWLERKSKQKSLLIEVWPRVIEYSQKNIGHNVHYLICISKLFTLVMSEEMKKVWYSIVLNYHQHLVALAWSLIGLDIMINIGPRASLEFPALNLIAIGSRVAALNISALVWPCNFLVPPWQTRRLI